MEAKSDPSSYAPRSTLEIDEMKENQTFFTLTAQGQQTALNRKPDSGEKESNAEWCSKADFTPRAFKLPKSVAESLAVLKRRDEASKHMLRMIQQKLKRSLKKFMISNLYSST